MKFTHTCWFGLYLLTQIPNASWAEPTNALAQNNSSFLYHLLIETNNLQSDAEINRLLAGTWRHANPPGGYICFERSGIFLTTNCADGCTEYKTMNGRFIFWLGAWSVTNGNVILAISSSNSVALSGKEVYRIGYVNDRELLFGIRNDSNQGGNEAYFLRRVQ
jgi:hypothetical protein